MRIVVAALFLTVVGAPTATPTASADSLLEEEEKQSQPTPWDRGRISLGVGLGSQSAFGERYFVIGGSVGYYVLPGLELALRGANWFGGDIGIARVSPEVRYVALDVPGSFKPYVGAFYNHWFIGDGLDDIDSVGGRAGIVFHQGSGFIIGGGVAVERIISECDACTDVYPDIIIAFTF